MLSRTVFIFSFLLLLFWSNGQAQNVLSLISMENDSAVDYYPQRTHHFLVENAEHTYYNENLDITLSFPFPWTIVGIWEEKGEVFHVFDMEENISDWHLRKYRLNHLNWGVGHPYWPGCKYCPMEHPDTPITISLKGILDRRPEGEWGIAVVEWGPNKVGSINVTP
jgi:hypothetical protein